jgi:two-component system cell cycle response regulator CtrA
MRILLIEDDPVIAGSVELMLRSENFHVRAVALGEEGVHLGKLNEHDFILLDLNLPDMSGYDVLRSLRTAMVKTPTLILSGLASVESKVKGLGFGADDYLTKPFHKDELIGRINAVLRRSATRSDAVVKCGDLVINLEAQRASIGDQVVRLTNKRVPNAGAYGSPIRKQHDKGNVPEPPLWGLGRARVQDHRRVHLQTAEEAG